jgi:hypothetical protein
MQSDLTGPVDAVRLPLVELPAQARSMNAQPALKRMRADDLSRFTFLRFMQPEV